ncbi:MAG TPA: hypothetical protein VFD82_02605 [Planctomycetota bacterium]|nr:hypothetical protein [Planctomycetota bacterium]
MHLPVGSSLALVVLLAPFARLAAQEEPEQSTRHFVGVDSGVVSNQNPAAAALGIPEVVWSTVVTVPQASWLRLCYAGVLLSGAPDRGSDGSFLRITSMSDAHHQTQHLVHVGQWQDTSAYFNGDSVLVEILACPGTGNNRLMIGDVIAGPILPASPDSICGTADNRVLSYDNRCARNQPTGCTSWMINDCRHCFLTAGHCASGVNVLEFNVPLSTSAGSIVHPPPADQYSVDPASKQTNGGQGTGNDWCYFGVFANSTTSLTPWQAYGGQAFDLLSMPPAVGGQAIRVTGYGTTSAPVSPSWTLVQKTHAGPYVSFTGTTVRYATDTTGGNSGSPVIIDGTNLTIGIHTHAGCTSTGGSNIGTGSNHAGLQAALANPLGICDCPDLTFVYPNGLPTRTAPNGTSTIRVTINDAASLQPGTVRFHVSTGTAWQTIVPTSVSANTFDAPVPACACGSYLQYYFTAQNILAATYSSPANAPTSVHSTVAADSLVVVRSYNFNTSPPAWSVVNTALTAGSWERGTPAGAGNPPADFDGSGQCWVTGLASNEDVDDGPTRLITETMNLTTSFNPVVRYALWFTNSTNDDRFVVEASNDGGTNWVQIEDLGPFTGWQAHQFRVQDHFPFPAQFVVRFTVSDNPDNSITEAALDAFRIDDITCTPATWTSYGTGCAGPAGVPSLQVASPPALGQTFILTVSNLSGGIPIMLIGLGQVSVPLPLPQFAPGCTLLVTPDILDVMTPVGGSAAWSLPIPPTLTLPGMLLYNQVFELGTPWTLSNAGFGEIR